jgi:hypothetical protein
LPEDLDDEAIESTPAPPYVRPTTFIHLDTLLQTPPPNDDHNSTPAISQDEDTLSARFAYCMVGLEILVRGVWLYICNKVPLAIGSFGVGIKLFSFSAFRQLQVR